MRLKSLRFATTLAIILALFVMMLGAYTRLTDAGLGCPDWPGCYGHMVLPSVKSELSQAQSSYPQVPIEQGKAWTEMAHRYAAGTLGLLILFIFLRVVLARRRTVLLPKIMPVVLLCLVLFQALLGMWTVTLKLLPVVVMGHLLGGMLIFASLGYFRWQVSAVAGQSLPKWRIWIGLGIVIVLLQIALGGWVSSNYAGIACIGFPICNGEWLPALHFSTGFNLFSPVGANYQGGLLENNARVTIQFIHRLGAVVTAAYVLILSGLLGLRIRHPHIRMMALLAVVIVCVQFTLGIINVVYLLPLWVAVAHNGVAALLLAAMCSLFYLANGERFHAR